MDIRNEYALAEAILADIAKYYPKHKPFNWFLGHYMGLRDKASPQPSNGQQSQRSQ